METDILLTPNCIWKASRSATMWQKHPPHTTTTILQKSKTSLGVIYTVAGTMVKAVEDTGILDCNSWQSVACCVFVICMYVKLNIYMFRPNMASGWLFILWRRSASRFIFLAWFLVRPSFSAAAKFGSWGSTLNKNCFSKPMWSWLVSRIRKTSQASAYRRFHRQFL